MINVNMSAIHARLEHQSELNLSQSFRLVRHPSNELRNDRVCRVKFDCVSHGEVRYKIVASLTARDEFERTRSFYEVFPDLGINPVALLACTDYDILVLECFAGQSLEQAMAGGALAEGAAADLLERLFTRLETQVTMANLNQVLEELDALREEIRACPAWGGMDLHFLDEIIFPYLQTACQPDCFRQRWTNGDLIARNILVNASGEARIVDHEFAGPTCLASADFQRFCEFSDVPDALKDVARRRLPGDARWWRLHFCLDHARKLARVRRPDAMGQDVGGLLQRLWQETQEMPAALRLASLLYQPVAEIEPLRGEIQRLRQEAALLSQETDRLLQDHAAAIARLQEQAAELDAARQARAGAEDRVQGKAAELDAARRDQAALREQVAGWEQAQRAWQQEEAGLHDRLVVLQRDAHDVNYLRQWRAQALASWSWRLTAPLRAMFHAGRWLRALATAWKSGLVAPGYYRTRYPDVAASRIPPFLHFMIWGWKELRSPHPLFDPGYYIQQINITTKRHSNPLLDYLCNGWHLGLNPHAMFNTSAYLQANPDVAKVGLNPLVHYLLHGAREGRRPNHMFDPQAYQSQCLDDPLPELEPFSRCLAASNLLDDRHQFPSEPTLELASPKTDIRLVAFYLPQYHRIPENDAWWGEGFTEWTNVRRGRPQFPAHYQPHVPHADTGYYDLDDPAVLESQARIARQYGLHGFCYYFYWFNGKRLLERPLDCMLHSGRPDFPFCLCWANENWTRRWDGMEQEILIAQKHTPDNDRRFINAVMPFLRDRRCIRVQGRPLFLVYRPMLLPEPKATFECWRAICRESGLGEIFLAGFRCFDIYDPRELSLDATILYPPHIPTPKKKAIQCFPDFHGAIYDYCDLRSNALAICQQDFILFNGVIPSWDNTARRQRAAVVFAGSSPGAYYAWLLRVIRAAHRGLAPEHRLVFINSWNEWGEGCHLEPDQQYGYSWLRATRQALLDSGPSSPAIASH